MDLDRVGEKILAAAREVAHERGYDVDVTDVARRAQIGIGTLYRRFSGKEGLVRELMREMGERVTVGLGAIDARHTDARDAIRATNALGFEMVREYGELATATVAGRVPDGLRDAAPLSNLDRFFGRLIKRGIEQGYFRRDLDVRYAVKVWKALVAPEPMRELLAESRTHSELAEQTSEFLFAAFRG